MNTLRSEDFQLEPEEYPVEGSLAVHADDHAAMLKQQVSERLAAHRSRRGRRTEANVIAIALPKPASKPVAKPAKARSSRIAAAVAERYAQSQSYRDFLAAEAERAIAEANATAEVAVRTAEAVTAVQQQLLAELDLWNQPKTEQVQPPTAESWKDTPAFVVETQIEAEVEMRIEPSIPTPAAPQATIQSAAAGLTVRLYEDVGLRQPELRASAQSAAIPADEEERIALDDEIEFRQAPVFEEPATPPVAIPANLIEFPRQLVAPRKARPRLAEGPLRDETDGVPAAAQLRIFEVEPEQISTAPEAAVESSFPEWSSIYLDASPRVAAESVASTSPISTLPQIYMPLQTAPMSQRAMAAVVDGCILGGALLAAVCAASLAVKELPSLPIVAIAGAAMLLVLFIAYHMLFFTFADATPGMRYARIGLCTFDDENPTRAEMRRRTWAILLAGCPLGLGFLWALLDEDSLGWHDRLSRMYQRAY